MLTQTQQAEADLADQNAQLTQLKQMCTTMERQVEEGYSALECATFERDEARAKLEAADGQLQSLRNQVPPIYIFFCHTCEMHLIYIIGINNYFIHYLIKF